MMSMSLWGPSWPSLMWHPTAMDAPMNEGVEKPCAATAESRWSWFDLGPCGTSMPDLAPRAARKVRSRRNPKAPSDFSTSVDPGLSIWSNRAACPNHPGFRSGDVGYIVATQAGLARAVGTCRSWSVTRSARKRSHTPQVCAEKPPVDLQTGASRFSVPRRSPVATRASSIRARPVTAGGAPTPPRRA